MARPLQGLAAMLMGSGASAWTPHAGLIAWLYGDSVTDSKWSDRSGNGHHFTLYGSPTLASDGMTVNEANSQYARLAESGGLTDGPFTACCWYKATNTSQSGCILFVGDDYGAAPQRGGIGFGAGGTDWDGTGEHLLILNGSVAWLTPPTAVHLGTAWHHLALAFAAGGAYEVWADGTSVLSGTSDLNGGLLVPQISVGYEINTRYAHGTIDDVMIYDSVLSHDEIHDIMANSPGKH
jgi:hypothetical protein